MSIAIDFDGVIHQYSKGWQNGEIYDTPIEGVFEAIQHFMTQGESVFIFSTRKPKQIKRWLMQHTMEQSFGDHPTDPTDWSWPKYGFTVQIIKPWTKFWNKKNVLGVTRRKLPATIYIDDRAFYFNGTWDKDTITSIIHQTKK